VTQLPSLFHVVDQPFDTCEDAGFKKIPDAAMCEQALPTLQALDTPNMINVIWGGQTNSANFPRGCIQYDLVGNGNQASDGNAFDGNLYWNTKISWQNKNIGCGEQKSSGDHRRYCVCYEEVFIWKACTCPETQNVGIGR